MNVGPFVLRPHQEGAVIDSRSEAARLRRANPHGQVFILVHAACGAGKSIISAMLTALGLEKGNDVLFMASGRQLIRQKASRLEQAGIPHSILMDKYEHDSHQRAVVASKDTLWSRCFESNREKLPSAAIVLIDEAHLATAGAWETIFAAYPTAIFIGFTATPALGNGKALPRYQTIVKAGTYAELIAAGLLVPCRVFSPWAVDMDGVSVNRESGEYVKDQVAAKYSDDALVGDVIRDWKLYAEDRATAVFCASVDHSIYVAERFNEAGIPAAHVDADTDDSERIEILAKAERGEIKCLCNYAVYTTGADFPWIECVQLVRAMKSVNTYVQTVGRGARSHTFPDGRVKRDFIVIDHGANVLNHGWPTEDHEWSLDPNSTVQERDEKKKQEKPPNERQPIVCPKCSAQREKGPECPNCGHKHTRCGAMVRMQNGDLKPLRRKSVKPKKVQSDDQKAWNQVLGMAANKNMTISQARVIFKSKKGYWPPDGLGNMPESHQWGVKASELFKGFCRRKKGGDA